MKRNLGLALLLACVCGAVLVFIQRKDNEYLTAPVFNGPYSTDSLPAESPEVEKGHSEIEAEKPETAIQTAPERKEPLPQQADTDALKKSSDKVLRIQVVDWRGNPLDGIQVLLANRPAKLCFSMYWHGLTKGPQGIVEIHDIEREYPKIGEEKVEAVAFLPLAGFPSVVVNPLSPPKEPVQLRLPQTGRVVVCVNTMAGTPFQGEAEATALLLEQKPDGSGYVEVETKEPSSRVENGKAVFSHVSLGFRIRIKVSFPSGNLKQVVNESDGPRVPGEEIVVNVAVVKAGPFVSGEIDVGDVRLRSAALLVAGEVLDEKGNPVQGVAVWIFSNSEWRMFEFQRRLQVGSPLSTPPDITTVTDEKGRFSVKEESRKTEFILLLRKEGCFFEKPLKFSRGMSNLKLKVIRGGLLLGSIVVPQNVSPTSFRISFSSDKESGTLCSVQPDKQGLFKFQALPPGRGTIMVQVMADPEPVALIRDVVIEPDKCNTDSRLQKMDLAAKVRWITITFIDVEDRFVHRARVQLLWDEDGNQKSTDIKHTDRNGKCLFLTARSHINLKVWKAGHRTAKIMGITSDKRIVLEPGYKIRVSLRRDAPLPKPPKRLICELIRASGRPTPQERVSALAFPHAKNDFNEKKEAVLVIPEPGTYVLLLSVATTKGNSTTSVPIISGKPKMITILESVDVQEFTIDFLNDMLKEAVDRLRKFE